MALEDYCAELKNYFIDGDKDIHAGKYTISNSAITLDFLDTNQYFRICGSKFNDGVYQYKNGLQLTDEVFKGAIWSMSVPPSFLEIVEEADGYILAHPNAKAIQSESFGGYSYTISNNNNISTFSYLPNSIATKLNRYRKLRAI